MTQRDDMAKTDDARWHNLGRLRDLENSGRQLVKIDGQQIALFRAEGGLFAIQNHCPHEGYPLMEGTLKPGCRLACNWHSWTFDLASGHAEVGRDPVRCFPVAERDGEIWIDLADPPRAERRMKALSDLDQAVAEYDYDRMARSLARLVVAGGTTSDALGHVIAGAPDRLEQGTTHAFAAGADWLAAAEIVTSDDVPGGETAHALVPALEFIAHLSHDMLHAPDKAMPPGRKPWDEWAFSRAIEEQDEAEAIARLRGGLEAGLDWAALEPVFARAALAHYVGFGHGLIYVQKTGELISALGEAVIEPLVCLLARYLTIAAREDLIPEFRALGPAITHWDTTGTARLSSEQLSGQSTRKILETVRHAGGDPAALHDALTGAAAMNMLRFDVSLQDAVDVPVSKTVNWLDLTHAVTFAHAVRCLCTRFPDLWPPALAQLACFIGRNAPFLGVEPGIDAWRVDDADRFIAGRLAGFFNHDEAAYIYFAHDLKLTMVVRREIAASATPGTAALLLAALNRYLSSRKRRKAPARVACQARRLVDLEG